MLLRWLREKADKLEPHFIRNKVAQLLVVIFELEYPAVWPSFFTDLIDMFQVLCRLVCCLVLC